MVVQHNLTAMNANRQLGVTTSAQAKSSEKLSSGYKINRAADDAAGLTISEKMRSQIRGLDQASNNAEDGISLIQSAEGALNEAHSILQRMNELSVQGANDTNQSIDRGAINKELDALTEELDRISTTTQFNKQNLLDGTFQSKNLQVGANTQQKIAISIDNMNAKSLGLTTITGSKIEAGQGPTKITYAGSTIDYKTSKTVASNKLLAVSNAKKTLSTQVVSTDYAMQYNNATGSTYYLTATSGAKKATAGSAMKVDRSNYKKIASTNINSNFQDYVTASTTAAKTSQEFSVGKASVSDYDTANATLSAVQKAINKVSTQRSALGALQNRLEHTVANLDTVSENTSAAESRIRDTDMADEMVRYSKNNILTQAGQSMLAQSNQMTQGVLSLLK